MLLTLSASKPEFGPRSHDRSSIHHIHSVPKDSKNSPTRHRASLPPLATTELSLTKNMSQSHRGLPPPAAMALPEPGRSQSLMTQTAGPSQGQMPAPPSQWQGAEESMRNWLVAKAEEERRRQEEERTRQETLRLEQRKIEQSMLRDSMKGGVPPHLVPIIFAGIGSSGSGGSGIFGQLSQDWLLQYSSQLQATQQQVSQGSSEHQRDQRSTGTNHAQAGFGTMGSTNTLPALITQQAAGNISNSSFRGRRSPSGTTKPSPSGVSPSSSVQPASHSSLPKLTTGEIQFQQSVPGQLGVQAVSQNQPTQQGVATSATSTIQQEQQSTSNPIHFYYYQPQMSQGASAGGPTTASVPSGKQKTPPSKSRERRNA